MAHPVPDTTAPHTAAPDPAAPRTAAPDAGKTARDPVCGMLVDLGAGKPTRRHHGVDHHFCSVRCAERFAADPAAFLGAARPPVAAPAGVVWTCPMHPEILRAAPVPCPICGMALEPVTPMAADADNPELTDMTRRLIGASVLTAPLVVVAMADMIPADLAPRLAASTSGLIQALLATPVVLWAGAPFFARAWTALRHRTLNMFSLIALGVSAAFALSLGAVLAPDVFPPGFARPDGAVGTYFESASVIVTLVLLGQVLELRARAATGGAIRALMDLAPKTARRLGPGAAEVDVPLDAVAPGDVLRVRPGKAVPVDGVVIEGRGAVDESLMTGEPVPVAKGPGDRVTGGTITETGGFTMRAEAVGADTALARIIALVAEAQRSRAPIQRLADQVSAWFVPAVVLVAALAFAAWALWGPAPALTHGLLAGLSVLVIACPCALGLATPMSIQVGIGAGARLGILIRSAEALERMERVDTLVVDKTGTLTEGRPQVLRAEMAPGFQEAELAVLAAGVERGSEHPLARAVLAWAASLGVAPGSVAGFRSVAGAGIAGRVDGRPVVVGNAAMLAGEGVTGAIPEPQEPAPPEATILLVAVDGRPAGRLLIADPIKTTTPAALEALRRAGVRVVMATGDGPVTAQAVGDRLGLDAVVAAASPRDKHDLVRRLRAEGRVVAMAGDGVNDAAALAQADVGVAMGAGADVALRAAGIVLARGDLSAIARARTLSASVMTNIRQNLVFAFAYNLLGVPLAAGALYPAFGLTLDPMVAAAAMAASSVSVIANALRLRRPLG